MKQFYSVGTPHLPRVTHLLPFYPFSRNVVTVDVVLIDGVDDDDVATRARGADSIETLTCNNEEAISMTIPSFRQNGVNFSTIRDSATMCSVKSNTQRSFVINHICWAVMVVVVKWST